MVATEHNRDRPPIQAPFDALPQCQVAIQGCLGPGGVGSRRIIAQRNNIPHRPRWESQLRNRAHDVLEPERSRAKPRTRNPPAQVKRDAPNFNGQRNLAHRAILLGLTPNPRRPVYCPPMPEKVGVLAIQGSYAKHSESLVRAGCAAGDVLEIRTPQELDRVGRLIIPGGESTTVGLLMRHTGIDVAVCQRAQAGMPIWGTCMGLIMLAAQIEGSAQFSLGLMDIAVRRNAFGSQIHSFEASIPFKGLDDPVEGVFIRAPIVTRCGPGVEVMSEFEGQVVGVRQGRLLGTSFHPELTEDTRLHRYFLDI